MIRHCLNKSLRAGISAISHPTLLRLAWCLLCGALMTLAFSPYDYPLIAILSLACFFCVLAHTPTRYAVLFGYTFGLGMFGTGIGWLQISINLFGGMSVVGAWCITLIMVAVLALQTALFAYLYQRFFAQCSTYLLVILLPTLWVVIEWLRSWAVSGFPWLSIGYSQIDTPISSLAPIFGIYGVSWFTALLSTCLATIWLLWHKADSDHKQLSKMCLSSFLLLCVCGLILERLGTVQWSSRKNKDMEIVIVQGAVPQELKWQPQQREKTLERYLSLSDQYPDSELIIWPETAIPIFYHQAEHIISVLADKASKGNYDYLIGVPFKEQQSGKLYNALSVIGSTNDIYYKRHLVPFGEYLPFDSWLRPITHWLGIPMSNFSAGVADKPIMHVANEIIGVSICYEDIFGEEVKQALPEATVLVNVSNDAWFGDSIAAHQHLQMARMRALETGRYMLRATNTGISAVIDEKGLIKARAPQHVPYALNQKVALFSGMTPYARFGDNLVLVPAFLLLATMLFLRLNFARR